MTKYFGSVQTFFKKRRLTQNTTIMLFFDIVALWIILTKKRKEKGISEKTLLLINLLFVITLCFNTFLAQKLRDGL